MLAGTLLSWHNLRTFQRWMETIRAAIRAGEFASLASAWRTPEDGAREGA
jgi:queuine/archaeosine tRNA-ribosyltransferase